MQSQLTDNLRETVSSANICLTTLPQCPQISLYLISEDFPRGRLPDEEMLAIMEKPAYWAFCWASGQVLASYLLSHPEICRNRSVLDLGAGSGVVAIAAAMAGAAQVIACDLDQHALDASRINAQANGVNLETLDNLEHLSEKVDLLIAADVLYDRENLEWLDRLQEFSRETLIADSRIRDPEVFLGYEQVAEISSSTIPDLDELKEFGEVSIYRRDFDTIRKNQPDPG